MTSKRWKLTSNPAAAAIKESLVFDAILRKTPIPQEKRQRCTASWITNKENQLSKEFQLPSRTILPISQEKIIGRIYLIPFLRILSQD
jgi:hypothetical protein